MKKLSVLLLLAFLQFGCNGQQQANDIPSAAGGEKHAAATSGPTGRIRGVIRLQGDAPPQAFEAISENKNVCGDKVGISRLSLGKEKGVQHAFVYLDGVPSSDVAKPRESLLVDQKNCQYAPHALIATAGSKIEITNSDPILHNVHAHQLTDQGQTTLFNVAQPVKGQVYTVDKPLTPGIVFLTCEAGHPWMNGYIFVANHPYVTLSGNDGDFVIDGVPPGTYRIKMWHEGVRLKRNDKTLQKYEYEEPYETSQEVKVEANGEAIVNFNLELRPGT
jgi:plastocyanin